MCRSNKVGLIVEMDLAIWSLLVTLMSILDGMVENNRVGSESGTRGIETMNICNSSISLAEKGSREIEW